MGEIILRDGALVQQGAPLYELPQEVTRELVAALFSAQPGDEAFIAEICPQFTEGSKLRLRRACEQFGGEYWAVYVRHAARWASLVNADNKWHIQDFTPIFEAEVNSWWAHTIIITTSNVRFVQTPRGLFTFPEFAYSYGVNIVEHLNRYREARAAELEQLVKHITSPIVKKRVTLADDSGNLRSHEVIVLESQAPDEWRLPANTRLMSVDGDGPSEDAPVDTSR